MNKAMKHDLLLEGIYVRPASSLGYAPLAQQRLI